MTCYMRHGYSIEMSSIVYAGVRYIQVRHAIQCRKCLETIVSKHIHDFKMCSCGAVGIDGGILDGNRTLGNLRDMENMVITISTTTKFSINLQMLRQVLNLQMAHLQLSLVVQSSVS